MRHYSTQSMIERLLGLLGTDDLNEWETGFLESMRRRLDAKTVTSMSDAQVTALENLFNKHFA
jgi:hypothetical protein